MIAHSSEFENIAVREEEQNELEMLARTSCPLEVKGGPSNKHGKISILIQVITLCLLRWSLLCNCMFKKLKEEKDLILGD